ncbi:MAG: sugar kinase [Defluviitaleaceae bacterium]|nr:sugar kinase [Defluviitaleaceae bacterium]
MKIAAFGEVMMRLTPPIYMMFEQSNHLTYSFVGTGVNILSGMSRFGHETKIITTLPKNTIGRVAKSELRKMGIDDKFIKQEGNHIGSYLVEIGYGERPSIVTYQNRLNSSFCESNLEYYNLDEIVKWADIVHICGITLSLTSNVRKIATTLANFTKKKGKTICFDFNFRPKLNENFDMSELKSAYSEILNVSDIIFCSSADLISEFDVATTLNEVELFIQTAKMSAKHYTKDGGEKIFCSKIDISYENGTGTVGIIVKGENVTISKPVKIETLDRIGAGDAFATGVLNGIAKNWNDELTLDFAMANFKLAHTTVGDVGMFEEEQILSYMANPKLNLIR